MKGLAVLSSVVFIAIFGAIQLDRVDAASVALEARAAKANGSIEAEVVAREREGLEALKAGKPEEFGKLTAEDAIFVDAAGPASKGEVLRNVEGFKLTEYSIDSLNFRQLSDKSGLISYRISETGNSHGKEFKVTAYVSSIWTMRGGKWICLFSQETSAK